MCKALLSSLEYSATSDLQNHPINYNTVSYGLKFSNCVYITLLAFSATGPNLHIALSSASTLALLCSSSLLVQIFHPRGKHIKTQEVSETYQMYKPLPYG